MWKLTLILAATTLAAGYVSAHLWQQLRAEQEQTARLEARVAELEQATAAARNPFAPLRQPPPVAETAAVAPRATTAAPSAAPADARPAAAPEPADLVAPRRLAMVSRHHDMLQDPEYRAAVRAQHRMMLPQSYPDVAKELNLTAEETSALFDLLANQQMESMDGVVSLGADGPPDPATVLEFQRKAEQRREAHAAELAALLGSAKYAQWQQYQESMGARFQVNRLRDVLDATGHPLTDEQARPLIAAIAAEQKREAERARQESGTPGPDAVLSTSSGVALLGTALIAAGPGDALEHLEQSIERTEEANRRLRDVAATWLTAPQLEQFERMLDQELVMRRAHVRMQRAQMQAMQGLVPLGDQVVSNPR